MLGADFFCSNHLLIDVYTSHIIDAKTYKSVPIWEDETPAPGINACSAGNEFADILKEFPSVTRPQFSTGDVWNTAFPRRALQCLLKHATSPS